MPRETINDVIIPEEIEGGGEIITEVDLSDKVSITKEETIFGLKTFSKFPLSNNAIPENDLEFANKLYVDLQLEFKEHNTLAQRSVPEAHPASAIEFNPEENTLTSANIQDVVEELNDNKLEHDGSINATGILSYNDNKTFTDEKEIVSKKYIDDNINALPKPLTFKGTILVSSDFPTIENVQDGHTYLVRANVTDNDPAKTNTGKEFVDGDEIGWLNDAWVKLGSAIPLHDELGGLEKVGENVDYGHIDNGIQTIYGVKTFNSFPVTPSSAPTENYQVANRKFITDLPSYSISQNDIDGWDALVSFPGFSTLLIDYGFTDNSMDWDLAFSWGDHSTENYLKNINSESISDLQDVDSIAGITDGKILKWLTNKFVIADDNDTTYTAGDGIDIIDAVIINTDKGSDVDLTDYATKIYADRTLELTKEPTGFTTPEDVIITYDSNNQTITLTGTVNGYYRGNEILELVPDWVSDPHPDVAGIYFLVYDGTDFAWIDMSNDQLDFSYLSIAFVHYNTDKFALRECHGLMAWETHRELHFNIGTYKDSGGTLGDYTLDSNTLSHRRPSISSCLLYDEDLPTTNPLLPVDTYSQYFLSGASGESNFNTIATDIVPLSTDRPYFNQFTGGVWTQTLIAPGNYMAIWVIAIPTCADINSQKYRYIFAQGQEESNKLIDIQNLNPNNYNLGALQLALTEIVFISKIIIQFAGGNWKFVEVSDILGNRFSQTSSPTGNYLSSVNTDDTLTGLGTANSPLSILESDPIFVASPAYNITQNDIDGWDALVTFPGFSTLLNDYNFTDNSTDWDLAHSHITEDGSSHTFIDQDVKTTASPSFAGPLSITSPNAAGVLRLARGSGNPTIKPYGSETWMIVDGNPNLGLNFYSAGDVRIAYGGGNVGIGLLTPSEKLDVNGKSRVRGDLDLTGGNRIVSATNGNITVRTSNTNSVAALRSNGTGEVQIGNEARNIIRVFSEDLYVNFNGSIGMNAGRTIISPASSGSQDARARRVENLAAYYNRTTDATGCIIFTAPTNATFVMCNLEITGMLYSGGAGFKMNVQGYRSTGNFVNPSKTNQGIQDIPVRWAINSAGNYSLILGEVGTVWSYPHIAITKALFSHGTEANLDAISKDWTVSLVTSLAGYTNITDFIPLSTMKTGGLDVTGDVSISGNISASNLSVDGGMQKNNLIINGDFKIWQTGTSFNVSGYSVDMWLSFAVGGAATFTQDLDVPANQGFLYSYKLNVTSAKSSLDAGDFLAYFHRIEGFNFASIIGKKGTLSFWVKTNKTGIYSASIRNSDSSQSYIKEFTVTASNTWQRKSLIFDFDNMPGTWLTDNGVGLRLQIMLASGATSTGNPDEWIAGSKWTSVNNVNLLDSTANYFNLAGVQLIEGEVDLPFIFEDYGTTLRKCQRYLHIFDSERMGQSYCSNLNQDYIFNFTHSFPVEMRIQPNMTTITAPTYFNCTESTIPWRRTTQLVHHRVINTGSLYRARQGVYQADARL